MPTRRGVGEQGPRHDGDGDVDARLAETLAQPIDGHASESIHVHTIASHRHTYRKRRKKKSKKRKTIKGELISNYAHIYPMQREGNAEQPCAKGCTVQSQQQSTASSAADRRDVEHRRAVVY